ncbi:MAG: DUF6492 family protein [Pseudomonadales bacterium]
MKSTALITPSWLPDLERCEQLIHSAQRHVEGFTNHYVLIDARDEKVFRQRLGSACEYVIKEDLLPGWLHQSRWNRKWWWSLRALPVRGWILQQVTKLGITQYLNEDAYCFADSDTRFVRRFSADQLWYGERLRFFRDTRKQHFYESHRYRNWYGFAARQFDLGDEQSLDGSYIAQLTAMRQDTVAQLLETLEAKHGRSWLDVMLRSLDFSEFVLYGVFVDECLNGAGHRGMAEGLCHSSWFFDIETQEDINRFVAEIDPMQAAVHLQSNLKLNPLALERALAAS